MFHMSHHCFYQFGVSIVPHHVTSYIYFKLIIDSIKNNLAIVQLLLNNYFVYWLDLQRSSTNVHSVR